MAPVADPGGQREIRALSVAVAIAAVWAAAEIALLAAIASAVRKAVTASSIATAPPPRGMNPRQQQAWRKRRQQAAATAAAQAARRLASLAAAIIATAIARTIAILIAAGINPRAHVPVPGDLARTGSFATLQEMLGSAGRSAYKSTLAIFREVTAAVPASGSLADRLAAAQAAITRAAGHGITGFTDATGRAWDVTAYVEMATRTTISNLIREDEWRQIRADGGDLAVVYSRWAEHICGKCLPWLGKTVSLTGSTPPGARVSVTDAAGKQFTATVAGTLQEMIMGGWGHPNCFPGDVLVSAPSGVDAAYSHWYEGDLVVIHTASGNELPATPNHPVLTPEGWVAAGALHVGGSVIRYDGNVKRVVPVSPDDEQIPARIGEVFDALRHSSPVPPVRVPASPEQFHGDGGGADVEVVLSDRLLQHAGHDAHGAGDRALLIGSTGQRPLFACRALHEFILASLRAANGVMRRSGQGNSLLGAQRGHAPAHAFAAADLPASVHEYLADPSPVHADAAPDFNDGQSFVVEPDRIVMIERRKFGGHVYNLQTGDGWYVASGIVVHNCRCGTLPVADGADLSDLGAPVETTAQAAVRHAEDRRQQAQALRQRHAARLAVAALTPHEKARARHRLAETRR